MKNKNLKSINVIACTSMLDLNALRDSIKEKTLAENITYLTWYGAITFILFCANSYFTNALDS